ncbi:PTPA-domain-containing protein [Athelia psychrophila]|uniref:Serine/threonine-protein phosphatase 2A activator n=1 Tax=Athelia psychrophila TaxID=1759441 RepID=A0A165ZDT9_9AGAM|nr:PTPA-domain-containing protein [Fibularhizoctonia sp. CBS 109695]
MALPPALRQIRLADLPSLPLPSQKIQTEDDVNVWKNTTGYKDYLLFLSLLNEAVVGVELSWTPPTEIESVRKVLDLLDTLESWITEIPPQPTPQRFGNLAFREWGKRLEEQTPVLLRKLLPDSLHPVIPQVAPYLLTSFGSFTRMDYGTGHETAWALFMCCLSLLRFFPFPVPSPGTSGRAEDLVAPSTAPDYTIERALALSLFPRYINLTWRLQDVYKLEPAGSHGVWGLDDSSFLGYYWGSAQMRASSTSPSSVIPSPATALPPISLYHTHLNRITQVKNGPFHEHSSQLYNIAMGVKGWGKVNSGLAKMYQAEVLGKRVVVQHIPLGGLIEWDPPEGPSAERHPASSESMQMTRPPTSISSTPPFDQSRLQWILSSIPGPRHATAMHTARPDSASTAVGRLGAPSAAHINPAHGQLPGGHVYPGVVIPAEFPASSTRAPWATDGPSAHMPPPPPPIPDVRGAGQ